MSLLTLMTVVLPVAAFTAGMLTLFGEAGYSLEQHRTAVARRKAAEAARLQRRYAAKVTTLTATPTAPSSAKSPSGSHAIAA